MKNFIFKIKGFTLVELSIVIVVIGLLIAGVSIGTNLIRQSETSSVIADFQSYQASYVNFVTRFTALPGDMSQGDAFWPTGCAASGLNCNGNGDGFIAYSSTSNQQESTLAWKHLSLSKATSQALSIYDNSAAVAGVNVPGSKVSGGSYVIANGNCFGSLNWGSNNPLNLNSFARCGLWNDNTTIAILIAKSSVNIQNNGIVNPKVAFSIDKKIDDGHVDSGGNLIGANTGSIRVLQGIDYGSDDCLLSGSLVYAISNTKPSCIIASAIPGY
jgi:prepilin-type N-terminal cleavage/methylation domain-containing protein